MIHRLKTDLTLWALILFNGYLIWYYHQHLDSFKTLVWLYWMQSIIIGVFNALDLLLIKSLDIINLEINGKPMKNTIQSKGCVALFFMVHYGFFHLGYAVFLLIQIKGSFDKQLFLLGVGLMFVEGALAFFKRKVWSKSSSPINAGRMFFLPYLRIVPMHLMILGPAFFGWNNISIFLWLKAFTDILLHLLLNKPTETTPTAVV